jgi:hypothetical protein
MTAPYSICHPCQLRDWHCPELEHCSRKDHHCHEQGSSVPSVPPPRARYNVLALVARNAPLGCTSLPSLPGIQIRTHTHKRARTNTGTPTSTPARATGNEAHMHTRTLALGREGHSRMRRCARRHGGHESSGDQRRKHPSDDHRPAANANQNQKQKSEAPLDPPALRLFRAASKVGVPPLAVGGADSIIHADNHNK